MKRYFLLMGILVAFFLLLFLVAEALELPVLSDPDPWLEDIRRRGGALEPERFLSIAAMLEIARDVARFLEGCKDRYPVLGAWMTGADLCFYLSPNTATVLSVFAIVKIPKINGN